MQAEDEKQSDRQYLQPEIEGSIKLDKVKFTYPGEWLPALLDCGFIIEPGEKVGLIGRIGSGKTTIAKLIINFYPAEQGNVFVDNLDVQQIDPSFLRKRIAYLPQDYTLFSGTIRENICYGRKNVPEDKFLQAVKMASIDQFTKNHPMGFDMQIGENGMHLSGGQRQQVAIARLFLSDPQVAIFDEPTAAMDDRAENAIKSQITQFCADKTLLLITHRGSTLDLVDRLIIIDGGKVIADGPKDKVLQALAESKIQVS